MSMSDDAADAIFGSGSEQSGSQQEDGQAVGAADHEADQRASGAGADDDDTNPFELVIGSDEPANTTEDGEAVGSADRDADAERSR